MLHKYIFRYPFRSNWTFLLNVRPQPIVTHRMTNPVWCHLQRVLIINPLKTLQRRVNEPIPEAI